MGLFLPNDEFAYVAANGKTIRVDGTDIRDRGTWDTNVAYNFNDVILWQNSLYLALQPNIHTPPTANQDDNWSVLVKTASGATNLTLEGLYGSIVYVGSIANEALNIANIAYDIAININPIEGDRLLYGGNAVWVSGYTFDVQPTGVSFFGTTYTYAGTTVTLQPSNPVLDRIDLIVATTAGTIGVLTGTPSIPPAPPGYDPSSTFELTPITVAHNTTQPSVQNVVIYDEDTGLPNEWVYSSTSLHFTPNDTTFPHTGLKDIAAFFAPSGDFFTLSAGSPVNLDNFSVLYLYIRPQNGWGASGFVRLNWLDTNNNWVGSYAVVQNGLNGFDSSNQNYQLIVMPLSAFGVPSGTFVTALQFTVFTKSAMGFNLDTIGLQYGVSQPPVVIPDASLTTKGIVLLEPNGGTIPGRVVTGDDFRLAQAGSALQLAQTAYDIAISINPDQGNRILSGGQVIWTSAYNFTIEPTVADFSGTIVSYAQKDITLQASGTQDRIDLILADITGTIIVDTGTASTPPAPPDFDPLNQIEITFIPVSANSTQPANVTTSAIYFENVEWDTSSHTAQINPNSHNFPFAGTTCVEATTAGNLAFIRFLAPTVFDLSIWQNCYFYIKLKQPFPIHTYFRLYWLDNNGNRVGNYASVTTGSYGFNIGSSVYQLIVVPVSAFSVPVGTLVRSLRLDQVVPFGTIGWYADNFALQTGVTSAQQTIPDATTTVKGIVQLEQNGGTIPGRAVTGDDYRLQLSLTGTNEAQAGINLANQALETAWLGTKTAAASFGTIVGYVSQLANSDRADMPIQIVNGVVTSFGSSMYAIEDFEAYGTGTVGYNVGDLNLRTNWYGSASINGANTNNPAQVLMGIISQDTMATYTQGTVFGGTLTGGTNWSTPWTSGTNQVQMMFDDLSSYSAGSITVLSGGLNWLTPGAVF